MSRALNTAYTQQNNSGAPAPFVAGKNKILNGDFNIWQRGNSFSAPGGLYTADRWAYSTYGTATTWTVSRQSFTPGSAPAPGYESAYYLDSNISSVGTLVLCDLQQKIEDVRNFAGQTVTLSFWIKTDSSRSLPIFVYQNFGSGGSADVQIVNGTTINSTVSWNRVFITFAVPSIAGKTIGTGSYIYFQIRQAAVSGSTLSIWGVQLEAGSVATPFSTATGNPASELAACQRYYWRISGNTYAVTLANCFARSGSLMYGTIKNPVVMRSGTPTFGCSNVNSTDFQIFYSGSSLTLATIGYLNATDTSVVLAPGGTGFYSSGQGGLITIAANATSAWIDMSAEL